MTASPINPMSLWVLLLVLIILEIQVVRNKEKHYLQGAGDGNCDLPFSSIPLHCQ